jgi:hypothetical protein
MPIKACADKLKAEIEMFGADFENYNPQGILSTNESKIDNLTCV